MPAEQVPAWVANREPRLVELFGIKVEADLAGHMLYIVNEDAPGFIGRIGTLALAAVPGAGERRVRGVGGLAQGVEVREPLDLLDGVRVLAGLRCNTVDLGE